MTPGEHFAPSVLLLEQESHLPYIKKVKRYWKKNDIANYRSISFLNFDYNIYTTNSYKLNAKHIR